MNWAKKEYGNRKVLLGTPIEIEKIELGKEGRWEQGSTTTSSRPGGRKLNWPKKEDGGGVHKGREGWSSGLAKWGHASDTSEFSKDQCEDRR